MKRVVLLFAMFVAACANKPAAQECPTGIVCPDGTTCAAAQAVCITNSCGNGVVDQGEVCDDGNIKDGDGCSADCKSMEQCGDGVRNTEAGEVCDDGNTISGDGCSADCKSLETCGNGITDVNEVCDDGNTHNGTCGDGKSCDSNADCSVGTCTPDGCSSDCKSNETCGNGIKDLGETCDDGGVPGGCEDDCKSGAGCGNGVIDSGEECDDGDGINTNDCTNNCKIATCGDGIVDSSGNHKEECDGGSGAGPVETAACNSDCTLAKCGDGKVNLHFKPDGTHPEQCDLGTVSGVNQNANDNDCTASCLINVCGDGLQDTIGSHQELCDDGNLNEHDSCNTLCQPTATCGDGIVEAGEECDLGKDNNGNNLNTTTSVCPSCKVAKCGDGFVSPNEGCDPGSMGETAACNKNCTVAKCGDGYVNTKFTPTGAAGPEQCDLGTGNNGDTLSCTSKCQIATCGDSLVQAGVEQCDTGGMSATCDDDCTKPVCGDGKTNTQYKPDGIHFEACDHGDSNGTMNDSCDAICQISGCGNGIVDYGEACDAGQVGGVNQFSSTCDNDCTTPVCGDGTLNTMHGEQCDNGSSNSTDPNCPYGITQCADRCNTSCQTYTPTRLYCGDSKINGTETCDDNGATQSKTACTYGTGACQACHSCALVLLPALYCGDGTITSPNEQCEPPNTTTCSATCQTPTCSDGVKDGLETDLDCGGSTCDNLTTPKKCADTKLCASGADCVSGVCDGHCVAATCSDGVKNGTETGVDCGNATCGGCAGDTCAVNGDCHSGSCGVATAGKCD
ncbi:MAG: DUF4215 domain-containing protein [Kofleriaceae bacterium]